MAIQATQQLSCFRKAKGLSRFRCLTLQLENSEGIMKYVTDFLTIDSSSKHSKR